MADDTTNESASPLPPKLDLRRSGVLKSAPASAPGATPGTPGAVAAAAAQPSAPGAPVAAPAAAPAAAIPSAPAAKPAVPRPVPSAASPAGAGAPQTSWRMKPAAPAPKPVGSPGVAAGVRPVAPVPAAAPPVTPSAPVPVAVGTPPAAKKETSRIPLAAAKPRVEPATPVEAEGETPAAAVPLPTVKISKPGETARLPGIPRPSEVISAEKRKTSRISLEAVLTETAPEAEGEGLKTIRLRRPGEAPVAKAAVEPAPEAAGAEGPSATQRKTVVVKRAPEAAGARKLTVARPAGEPAAAPVAVPMPAVPEALGAREPNVVFGLIAIAATLVMVVLIYLFCSQVVGPNSSMTQYSYAPGGPNLGWPGKIVGQR